MTQRFASAVVHPHLTFDYGTDPAGPILVSGLAVPWSTTVELNWWGDTVEFAPGSIEPKAAGHIKFLLDHANHGIGFGVAFDNRPDGLWCQLAIPRDELDDPDTAAAVRQMRNGIRDALSIGVALAEFDTEPHETLRGAEHLTVTRGQLYEVSSVLLPRFDDARVDRIAANHPTRHHRPAKGAAMSDTEPDTPPDPTAPPEEPPDELEARRRAQHEASRSRPARTGAVPSRFGDLGEYVYAVAAGQVDPTEQRRVGFALTDVTTTDIAGLLPPTWIRDFAEELSAARPFVSAFDTRPLPDSGMNITWPKKTIAGPIVGEQVTQKTDIVSGKVSVTATNSPITTYAGGNDVSIQAILRSDPSYLSVLFEEYAYALAAVHDVDVITDVLAAIPVGGEIALSAAAPTAINTKLANGARLIWAAGRGARPDRLVMGLGVWEYFASAADATGRPLFPNMSGANPVGTLDITTETGEARGLAYVVDPYLNPAKAVMGWSRAITNWVGPVSTLAVDVPAKLGRDVAIYQFGALAIRRVDALVEYTLGA